MTGIVNCLVISKYNNSNISAAHKCYVLELPKTYIQGWQPWWDLPVGWCRVDLSTRQHQTKYDKTSSNKLNFVTLSVSLKHTHLHTHMHFLSPPVRLGWRWATENCLQCKLWWIVKHYRPEYSGRFTWERILLDGISRESYGHILWAHKCVSWQLSKNLSLLCVSDAPEECGEISAGAPRPGNRNSNFNARRW